MSLVRGLVTRTPCLVAGMLLLIATSAQRARSAELPTALQLSIKKIPLSSADPKETRVGQLVYRGGIEITSSDPRFGGWSGLLVSADGTRVLALSDRGHWLRARPAYDARGTLTGLEGAQLEDLRAPDGHRLVYKQEADAEALAALNDKGPDGPVAVSFERDARIWRYDLAGSLAALPTSIPIPPAIDMLDSNAGLEALARLSDDRLLAVAEKQNGGTHAAWLVPIPRRKTGTAETLTIAAHSPYEISDAAMSPDCRWLYLLERHYFGLFGGVAAAVRRVDASAIRLGARLEGEDIARFTLHENIDNMEGMALRRGPGGRTLLYMISDDNYDRLLQRTVLLMFEVTDAR